MADADKVDPAEEPESPATPADTQDDIEPGDVTEPGDGAVQRPNADGESDGPDDDRELVAAGRGSTRASRSAGDDGSAEGATGRAARSKKDKATPKQKQDTVTHQRTSPVTFVKQSVGELRKVVYPTGPQLANYFIVVLIFVLFVIAYVSLLDLGIGAAIFRIFA
ncbi:MAG: preprotein translocase subunit SecE [Microlunatus sp.]|nr:preprotein translocase subunit SecE [Microlunatus sp.]